MSSAKFRQSGIECPNCKENIFSNSRHDFVACKCNQVFIDGGFDYQRIGYSKEMPITVYRELDKMPGPYFRDEKRKK